MRLVLSIETNVPDNAIDAIRSSMESGAHVVVSIPINGMRDEINLDGPLIGAKEPAGA